MLGLPFHPGVRVVPQGILVFDVRLALELSVERKLAVLHGDGIPWNSDKALDQLEIGLMRWIENQDVPTSDRGVSGETCPPTGNRYDRGAYRPGNPHTHSGTIRDQKVPDQKRIFHGPRRDHESLQNKSANHQEEHCGHNERLGPLHQSTLGSLGIVRGRGTVRSLGSILGPGTLRGLGLPLSLNLRRSASDLPTRPTLMSSFLFLSHSQLS